MSTRTAYLTLEDVCEILEIARRTFYEWRKKGIAPKCIKLPNGDLRIRQTELDRWIETREEN